MAPWHCELVERTHRRGGESAAFTLIELFVVMATIGILLGLAFPAFTSVQNSTRKTQAKNDLVQIVTAVNAFYTEYGKYPLVTADTIYGPAANPNSLLFNALRGISAENPRKIVFISPPDAKDTSKPRSGIGTSTGSGQLFDPWGSPYYVSIDGNYNNQIDTNPYSSNAGSTPLRAGVIAWSFGRDGQSESASGTPGNKNTGTNKDDVISWQ